MCVYCVHVLHKKYDDHDTFVGHACRGAGGVGSVVVHPTDRYEGPQAGMEPAPGVEEERGRPGEMNMSSMHNFGPTI